jgi:hypothetical protein
MHLSLEEHTYVHKYVDALTVRIRAAVYGSDEMHPTERHEDGEGMDAAEQSTPAFEGATDGSMRELGPLSRKTPLAGAAWAIWPADTTQVLPSRYGLHHIHSRANFSSPDACTSGDPCKLSSTHTGVAGIHQVVKVAPVVELKVYCDSQAALAGQARRAPTTAGGLNRDNIRYQTEQTRELLANKPNISLHKVAGHTGDPHNEWVDSLAKQAAGRSCAYPPPRFPEPIHHTHSHLYYYDSLVQDDTRAHVTMACEAHHLQHWLTMEGHGKIRVSANDRDTTLLRRNTITKGRKHTRPRTLNEMLLPLGGDSLLPVCTHWHVEGWLPDVVGCKAHTASRVWRYCIGAVARMIYRGLCRRLPRAVANWNYLGGGAT